ncbi:MAG: hypothetical protein NBKEAIPA_03141 [Nitrospirae bacterium]|nr:hypothetical protein [Nitrospirota bacterium]
MEAGKSDRSPLDTVEHHLNQLDDVPRHHDDDDDCRKVGQGAEEGLGDGRERCDHGLHQLGGELSCPGEEAQHGREIDIDDHDSQRESHTVGDCDDLPRECLSRKDFNPLDLDRLDVTTLPALDAVVNLGKYLVERQQDRC